MSDNSVNSLAVPWIIVVILSVVVAGETVYLVMLWRRQRGPVRARQPSARPETQWYELRGRNEAHRATGFSPIEPKPTRWR